MRRMRSTVPWLVVGLLGLLPACAPAPPPAADRAASHSLCGIEFSLPDSLHVVIDQAPADPAPTECSLIAARDSASAREESDAPPLWIGVYSESFEAAAARAGFERSDGGWIVRGRQGMASPADTIAGAGWSGVRGVAQVGAFDERGYAGLEETPRAVLSDGRSRSVIVNARPWAEDAFEMLLRTIRFAR